MDFGRWPRANLALKASPKSLALNDHSLEKSRQAVSVFVFLFLPPVSHDFSEEWNER